MVLFPPDLTEDAFSFVYKDFTVFTQHTEDELKAFELRHSSTPLKTIKNRQNYFSSKPTNTVHLKLPKNSGLVTKSTLPILYGAIVCLALRDMSYTIQKPFSTEIKQVYARSIYSYFSLFASDARYSCYPLDMIKIMLDVHNHGYHAASTLNSVAVSYCPKCSKRKDGSFVQMEECDESPTGWRCSKCGRVDFTKRGFTPKHLRNMQLKVFHKLTELVNYQPLFLEICNLYKRAIEGLPSAREYFQKRFNEYELQGSKDLLSKRERWVIAHSDTNRKSKCYIPLDKFADIGINDERYILYYKPAIARVAESLPKYESERQFEQIIKALNAKLERFFESAGKVLKILGWPEAYISDKVRYDLISVLAKR